MVKKQIKLPARKITARIVQRHYIFDKATTQEYSLILSDVKKLKQGLEKHISQKYTLEYLILANYARGWKPKTEKIEGIKILTSRQTKKDGPGVALDKALFRLQAPKGINILYDGGKYQSTALFYKEFADFIKKMHQQKVLLGIGARNIVKLVPQKELDEKRLAFESFLNSMTSKVKPKNPYHIDLKPLHRAYAAFGDGFPGLYAVNGLSKDYPKLKKRIDKVKRCADTRIFIIDYYLPISAAINREKILAWYFPLKKKHFVTPRDEEQITRLIQYDYSELLKTDISKNLRKHQENPQTWRSLERCFKKKDVDWVRERMFWAS
jgi:hypothetical protein